MKVNSKIVVLIMNLALLYTHNSHTIFNDDFEEEMLAKINLVQEQVETTEKNIQSSLKEFHNQFFQDFDTRTKDFPNYASQQKTGINQIPMKSYQQSSNSLSFTNNEKTIKIGEQKDNNSTTFIIKVTNKSDDSTKKTSLKKQEINIQDELQDLESYIKKNFRSKPAHKILEECLHAMTQDHKDRLINIASSTHGNEKEYTIEIAHKKEVPVVSTGTKKYRKKRKSKKVSL